MAPSYPLIFMSVLMHNDGHPIVSVGNVATKYFDLTVDKFLRKVRAGEIEIPLSEMEAESRKSLKGVLVTDLARYLVDRSDAARELARKRCS